MFDNIGSKLQGLAKFICWVGIIFSALSAIITIASGGSFLAALLGGAIGALFSWIGSWVTYAIGEIAERAENIEGRLSILERQGSAGSPSVSASSASSRASASAMRRYSPPPVPSKPKKTCPQCGANNNLENKECFACGSKLE